MRRVSLIAVVLMALAPLAVAQAAGVGAANTVPVLGSTSYSTIPDAQGWGTARPHEIFNGGDPSGHVVDIRWTGWGTETAYGRGSGFIFKPGGGYYPPVGVELRATSLGRCGQGPRAYTQLDVRQPSKPGGKLGRWSPWGNARGTIC
jgi:hypothetical protein